MSKKVRMILLIGLVVLVLVGGFGIFYYKRFLDYNQAIQAITIREPDLTQLEDGEYVGIHDVDFIRAKVKVEVKDHRFQTIKILEHITRKNSGTAEGHNRCCFWSDQLEQSHSEGS